LPRSHGSTFYASASCKWDDTIENLDATVATVGNRDMPERAADENAVRIIEIAASRSFVAPGLDEPAVLGKKVKK
jgi:hypothetical protein